MTRLFTRLTPRTVVAQIVSVLIVSVLLGHVLTTSVVLLFFDETVASLSPAAATVRIATITQLARASQSTAETARLLATARRSGIRVEHVQRNDLVPANDATWSMPNFADLVLNRLEAELGIVTLDATFRDGERNVVVELGESSALVFQPFPENGLSRLLIPHAVLTLSIITIIALLSIYAVRWITSPLSVLAAAARSFGRSADDASVLTERGPHEITQVARAFNEMRTRIGALLNDRTRMLAAISHDLRTPLTRLRLRAERVTPDALREGMLHDVGRISHMLDETLAYLRDDVHSEQITRVDLPSLLQTICSEFTDVGQRVTYEGPNRFTCACSPSALTRAVTNIVENGAKHGENVTINLRIREDRAAQIEVCDDGPGIEVSVRDRVFEPFFKADGSRPSATRGGFGLGLSIARDIIHDHGGRIDLAEREPRGLRVSIVLPAENTGAAKSVIAERSLSTMP